MRIRSVDMRRDAGASEKAPLGMAVGPKLFWTQTPQTQVRP